MSEDTTPLPGGDTPSPSSDRTASFTPYDGAPPRADAYGFAQPSAEPDPEPQWITGPSSATVLAGLLTLVIAALAIVRLSTDVAIEWSIAAPVTVIAVGVMAVVLGATSFSRRSSSAEHESTE